MHCNSLNSCYSFRNNSLKIFFVSLIILIVNVNAKERVLFACGKLLIKNTAQNVTKCQVIKERQMIKSQF